jgi:hypothetical protein
MRVTAPVQKALLSLSYYVVFVPLAWVLRQFHDVLDQQWDVRRVTYFDSSPDDSRPRTDKR